MYVQTSRLKKKQKLNEYKSKVTYHHTTSCRISLNRVVWLSGFFSVAHFLFPSVPSGERRVRLCLYKKKMVRQERKRNETKANKPFHPQRDQKSTALWRACGRICILTIPPLLSFYILEDLFVFCFGIESASSSCCIAVESSRPFSFLGFYYLRECRELSVGHAELFFFFFRGVAILCSCVMSLVNLNTFSFLLPTGLEFYLF